MREAEPVPTKPEKEAGKRSGAPTTPSDVKTYSNREAKAEWDDSREAKRRMVLGRIGQRDSNLAVKAWDEMTRVERLEVHVALNEDFISPTWYINAKGQKTALSVFLSQRKSLRRSWPRSRLPRAGKACPSALATTCCSTTVSAGTLIRGNFAIGCRWVWNCASVWRWL